MPGQEQGLGAGRARGLPPPPTHVRARSVGKAGSVVLGECGCLGIVWLLSGPSWW